MMRGGWGMRSVGRFGAGLAGSVLAAVAGVSGCQKPDVVRTGAEGSGIAIRYEAPTDTDRDDAAFLRRRKVVEEAASAISALVEVDRRVSVGVVSCGGEGSSYDPELTHVEVCYDEVSETRELFRRAGPGRADDDVAAVMLETLYHEMAHALVDVLELRVRGREEDVADQFAALMLLREGASGEQRLLAAADAWHLSEVANEDADDGPDEHSSDGRRAVNHRCYVYGAASGRHRGLVGADALPAERAKGCAKEWNAVRTWWTTALAPHLRAG
ncbi:DUF4344 domain-containing metallopeptidase [Streptomyces lancefieldiae]|uniref:DUF4344 domain-containing metallopeptidase n=1 Tax=Streptomyces lancefieldiae TaxID=3075520 RepID=A0ABU3AHP4_9ACTN|nr:DUF4344 domain-containing metallopeptidase [Streptomyces sp. DSM 40712]MDT0609047.1 DUF4344 domain-containing metallopeptidase [Streptomyces sp. DSM 40712]